MRQIGGMFHTVVAMVTVFHLASSTAEAATARPEPRNVLIITADDLNADSMGWVGSKMKATPHIDAFARTAHRFEQLHTTAAICQPSRSALLTGRVPHRNGALGFQAIGADIPTLMELLSSHGYFTAIIEKAKHSAVKRGRQPWDLVLGEDKKIKGTKSEVGRTPKLFGENVAQAIAAAAAAKKPFFINANITDPHRPFYGTAGDSGSQTTPFAPASVEVPSVLEDLPPIRTELAQYFTSVRRFDESIGQTLRALDAAGERQRTLVIFLSDHGMPLPFAKATAYRNATWTPALLWWPGMGTPVVDKNHMVSNVDILPTVLDVLKLPAAKDIDGRSLLPLLRGQEQSDRDHVVTHINTTVSGEDYSTRCVRSKTRSYIWQPWSNGKTQLKVNAMGGLTFKAMVEAGKQSAAIHGRVEQMQLGVTEQLFDLQADPDERRNVLGRDRYHKDLGRMRALLLAHMQRTGDPLLAKFKQAIGK